MHVGTPVNPHPRSRSRAYYAGAARRIFLHRPSRSTKSLPDPGHSTRAERLAALQLANHAADMSDGFINLFGAAAECRFFDTNGHEATAIGWYETSRGGLAIVVRANSAFVYPSPRAPLTPSDLPSADAEGCIPIGNRIEDAAGNLEAYTAVGIIRRTLGHRFPKPRSQTPV